MTGHLRSSATAVAAVLSLLLAGCGLNPFAAETTTVSATFPDVVDLVTEGSVKLHDVDVGRVQAIELTDANEAHVTMAIDAHAPVPRDVTAVLAKTSVLGERYIDLVPGEGESTCCIEDGSVIDETHVRTDLEDLVASGSHLLAEVSSAAVQTTIELGAEAFGGRSDLISRFVGDLSSVVSIYDDNSDDLLALIDSLDRVTAAYAPNAAENAAVLEDLRVATAALQEQDDRLLDTLDDVTTLSDEAVGFLSEHQDEIADSVRRLRLVLEEVEEADQSIRELIEIGPYYLSQLRKGELNGEAQVWLDTIACVIHEDEGEVDSDCNPPNSGQRSPQPSYHPVPRECWIDPEPCTGRER